MSNTITIKLSSQQEKKLYQAFQESSSKTPQYAKWQLRPENCVITCYESGKTVFQGKDAQIYAAPFMENSFEKIDKQSEYINHTSQYPQAGSDEVGTGDYFGPVCVCATIVEQEHVDTLVQLGVKDSKKLTDEDIRKIAPKLIKMIPYSLLILDNEKYNQVHETNNMNEIKAKLHNQAYVNLSHKQTLPQFMIIDQFTPETSYYRYLKHESHVIRLIHFETKAEDKYLAVGAASIIARFAFLTKWDQMEEKYEMHFEKGASEKVDDCASTFVSKYGWDQLHEVAKLHFKNTERIK